MTSVLRSGAGLGWRPETAWACAQRASLPFVEVIAESIPLEGPLPRPLTQLLERGVPIVVHGVSLSLGSGEPPDPTRLARLRRVCERVEAPIVSEHIAFVRGAGHETEHLLPIRRTPGALEVLVDNVRRAQDALDAPLALENIAHLFEWPGAAMPEAELLAALTERTGCSLVLDAANLHANAINFGCDVDAFLDVLPLSRVRYAHIAGGLQRGGFHHDTHAHPVGDGALAVLAQIVARRGPLPVLLERDDGFTTRAALETELDAIDRVLAGDVAAAVNAEPQEVRRALAG